METIKKINKIVSDEISDEWFQFIKDNPDKPWNWIFITANLNITNEIIDNNPDYPWNKEILKYRKNAIIDKPMKKIYKLLNLFNDYNIELDIEWEIKQSISSDLNLTWKIVKNKRREYWNWFEISRHPNITWDIIKNNPNKPWEDY